MVAISLGTAHCLAVTKCGKVFAWGGNDKGQLGLSNYNSKNIPTEVAINEEKSFNQVACGPAQVGLLARAFYVV